MSLNNIQLSPVAIANLYENALVDLSDAKDTRTVPVSEKMTEPSKALGNNNKNILIIVNYPGVPHIPDNNLPFLTSILSACKLNLGDVAIVNFSSDFNIAYPGVVNEFSSRVVLLLDVTPGDIQLPVDFPMFQVQSFNNTTYVHAPSLTSMEDDKQSKRSFWEALKKTFNL